LLQTFNNPKPSAEHAARQYAWSILFLSLLLLLFFGNEKQQSKASASTSLLFIESDTANNFRLSNSKKDIAKPPV
jgi:hypothetical protein